MKRKLLTLTLLSMSLLSINVSAAGKLKCTDTHCFIDNSSFSPKSKKVDRNKVARVKTESIVKVGYETVMIDNIETIVFSDEKYVMTQDEIAEYDLQEMQKTLLTPVLSPEGLPTSEYLCEENMKVIKVVGLPHTFDCA